MPISSVAGRFFACGVMGMVVSGLVGKLGEAQSAVLPPVHLLATGGTIAGGTTGTLKGSDLAELLPGLDRIARLTVEDFSSIGSSRMTPELQFDLAKRVNALFDSRADLAGIVITHGTDSLEETAFLLDLLVTSDRPVVFAAAQRPPRMPDSDGARNLLNAVRIAALDEHRNMGVLVTLNDEIHSARDVRKTHSIALNAFQSPWVGPVGVVDGERVYFFRNPLRRLVLSVESIEPKVDLITLVAGSDGHLIRASAQAGAKGIVVEVFGRGNVPPAVMDAIKEVRQKGVTVVFTTRTRGGRVELGDGATDIGVVSGEDLDGLKARMLLIATLAEVDDLATLQSYFRRLSGEVVESSSRYRFHSRIG